MYLCRSAWQKLVPLTHRGAAALRRNASVRQMSSSSVPGSSGGTLPYYLFVIVTSTAAGFYVYRTISSDKERFKERQEYISTKLTPAFEDSENESKVEATAVAEPIEEVVEEVLEEEATELLPAAEDEAESAPTEQEPAPSTEAASEQVEPENIESVGKTLEESSIVLEASSENITEELASAAEDWSELTARKPEETVVEGGPVAEESEEAVESEEASASS